MTGSGGVPEPYVGQISEAFLGTGLPERLSDVAMWVREPASVMSSGRNNVVLVQGVEVREGESVDLVVKSFGQPALWRNVCDKWRATRARRSWSAAERTLREAEWVLGYWCEHTDRPVVFVSEPPSAPEAAADDPFAAFAAPTVRENTVSRPFALDAPVTARGTLGDLTVLVGVTDTPRFAFYSHGLTLVNTEDRAVLGEFAQRLGHLHIKVAGPGLGHTVTRDNVVHDAQWRRAMELVDGVCADLRQRLVDTIGSAVTRACLPEDETRWLARELMASGEAVEPDRPLFLDTSGTPRTLAEVAEQEDERAVVLVGEPDCAITQAVCATGDFVLRDSPAVRELLMAVPRSGVPTEYREYQGQVHIFWMFGNALSAAGPTVKQLADDIARHLD